MSDPSTATATIKSRIAQSGFRISRFWIAVLAVLFCGLFIVASIAFADRPLALYAVRFQLYEGFLTSTPVTSPILLSLAMAAVLAATVLLSSGFVLPAWARSATVAAILAGLAMSWGLCVTELLLKPLFARHEPFDFLAHGTYGFVWLTRADNLGSFPSGHAVQITSLASVLWAFYPRGRALFVGVVALVAIALIVAERHFLSDILAGSLVGAGAGFMMVRIWRTRLDDPHLARTAD